MVLNLCVHILGFENYHRYPFLNWPIRALSFSILCYQKGEPCVEQCLTLDDLFTSLWEEGSIQLQPF